MKSLILAALVGMVSATTVVAGEWPDPRVLGFIGKRVEAAVKQGAKPVVLFDIDDTLADSRTRMAAILKKLGRNEEFQARYGTEARLLASMHIRDARYSIEDTLAALGVHDPEASKAIIGYWRPLFFSDLCALDRPVVGAGKYLRYLASKGAKIVYLTGRDEPGMGKGTRKSLERLHFPLEDAQLIMRPGPTDDELEYKKRALEAVRKMGVVIGVFENEPRNLNMMIATFPNAVPVFLNTIHSSRPDRPDPRAIWVENYRPIVSE